MGKGGTKFCGDAIGSRTGKGSAFPTGKDRRKAMERCVFLECMCIAYA